MKGFLFGLLFISTLQANAQQFFFSKENYKDSATLADSLSSLATIVMTINHDANKHDHYNNMFRYAIVARQYAAAISYLHALRNVENSGDSLAAKGIGFQYEIYAKTKLQQQKNH